MPGVPAFKRRHIVAVAIGNALEFYDFLTFGFFAVYISRAFFPADDPVFSLLSTLATFGIGFTTRPIGAIVIGSMGDRLGRRPAMLMSFGLMGIAIVGLALTPSYAAIGPAAPIIVIFWRLVQGFALGGEVGPSTAYLVEAAPPRHRGFFVSWQSASQQVAVLASGLVGTALVANMNDQQLQDWGWRIAMLIGVVIVPFGFIIRRTLPETHEAPRQGAPKRGIAIDYGPHAKLIVLGLIMLAFSTIGTYVINYMSTYALTTLKLPKEISFGIIIVQGVVGILMIPAAGALSDRIGRRPVMLVFGTVLLLSIVPVFWLMTHNTTVYVFYAGVATLVTLQGFTAAPIIVLLTEQLPGHIRSGSIAIIYATAIAIFGGSAQFMVAWLQALTGDPLTPAYYWTAALAAGFLAMTMTTESAPRRVARGA